MIKKTGKYLLLIMIIFLSGLFAACNQGPAGIFATIEETQKVDQNRGMPGQATIFNVAVHDQNHLIAVTGRQLLHRKAETNAQWVQIPFPAEYSYVLDAEVFTVEGQSYAAFLFSSDSGRGLYIVEIEEVEKHKSGDLDLGSAVAADITHEISGLFSGDGALYVSVRTSVQDNTYGLYRLIKDGDDWDSTAVELNNEFGNLAEIAAISSSFVLSRETLYEIDDSGLNLTVSPLDPDKTVPKDDEVIIQYMDMAVLGDTLYVVSNRELYHAETTASSEGEKVELTNVDTHKNILSIAAILYEDQEIVFLGTQGSGFVMFEDGAIISPRSSSTIHHINFGGTALSRIPVQTMKMFQGSSSSAPGYIYAGTAGNGLWEGLIRGDTDDITVTWGKE
ncbi:hypothetical protein [Spirochaeta dissipatitropha]